MPRNAVSLNDRLTTSLLPEGDHGPMALSDDRSTVASRERPDDPVRLPVAASEKIRMDQIDNSDGRSASDSRTGLVGGDPSGAASDGNGAEETRGQRRQRIRLAVLYLGAMGVCSIVLCALGERDVCAGSKSLPGTPVALCTF